MGTTYKILVALSGLFFSFAVQAECNLKLAISAGQYLNELEKAHLSRYQNNSVCEVLSYEFGNCSPKEQSKLKESFNVIEVLGNYCQPHLPPARLGLTSEELMKGAELYSWKEYEGYLWYALLPGTNRMRESKELIANKITEGQAKELLRKLPPKTILSWNNLVSISDKEKLDFSFPSVKSDKELRQIFSTNDLTLMK